MVALAKKDAAMKQFGTVNSFNAASGHGSIRPDNDGSDLGFDSSDLSFIGFNSPKVGQRMSYHVSGRHGHASAIDVHQTFGQWVPDACFAGLHPGDRFSGDARIGQCATTRIVPMPVQYRGEYVDTDRFYYGFDNGRVYQIDRQSRMVLALFDMAR